MDAGVMAGTAAPTNSEIVVVILPVVVAFRLATQTLPDGSMAREFGAFRLPPR
jgi:hypothetical protein